MKLTTALLLTGLSLSISAGALMVWQKRSSPIPLGPAEIAKIRCEPHFAGNAEPLHRPILNDNGATYPYALSIHDHDDDGRPDIVVADADSQSFRILRNKGGLDFSAHVLPRCKAPT